MDKHFHRRKRSYLRAAAIFAWMLQGIFAPLTPALVFAKNPDAIKLGVRAGSDASPDAISNLLASPNLSISGQISLSWTAPQGFSDIPGATVANYIVHYATFSIDSLLGDTTAWWNATNASSTTLQPPVYNPQAPGSLEGYTFTGLAPATTYYFAIKSTGPLGVLSLIDTKSSTPGQQAFAVTSAAPSAAPKRPNGVLSTPVSNGNQVQLTWSPVTRDTSGNPITIDHYLVQRYLVIGGTPTVSFIIPAPSTTYTDTSNGADYFYTIQAISSGGAGSALSDYLDSLGNRYAIASDDLTTRVVMPHDAASYLIKGNNSYGDDLEVILTRQPQNEVNVTLRSYLITAQKASTDQTITPFSFPLADISVQLGYGAVIGPSPHGGVTANQWAQANGGSIAQIISVFWFNGANYIRISDPVLTSSQALAVTVRNLGRYEIRAVTIGYTFHLSQGSPYPRVITPNGAENHRVFWFFENPSGDPVSGTIYDIRGAKVRTLEVNSMSPSSNSLVWDGRDSQGSVVPSGVYLYKISTTDATVTGTVVVAR